MKRSFTDQQHADALAFAQQIVKNPRTNAPRPGFMRTGGIKPPPPIREPKSIDRYQSPPFDPNPPMMGTMGGDGTGEYPLGSAGPRVDPSSPNYVPPGTAGIKPLPPVKQPPIMSGPMPPPMTGGPVPPPAMGGFDDLFGDPGAGSYDNLMSRAFQEYSSGQSPYAGATDFLMNRSVFDRGARPETSMPSTDMPSYGYSDAGGSGGLAAMQAQQPGLQAQYDQFAQQIQSAQEAAQQQAQQQTDMASSERQALMDRIAALEGQEGPDLDAFGAQLRQDILGQMPEQIDTEALRREITGEVLALAQQDFPDVTQIRDEVMRLLPEQEQVDVENLRRQIQESIDRGAPPEQIDALRQELQNRIRPVEEQLQGLQESRGSVAEQIGELRGQVGALPDIDVDAIRQQIISQLPEQERVDIESLQRRIQDSIDAGAPEQEIAGLRAELNQRLTPVEERVNSVRESVAQFRQQFDPSSISEQIGNLRGRLEGLPNIDIEDIRRRVQEGIDARQAIGINPDAQRQIEELRRRFEEGRGRMDPDVLERLRAVEGRQGPDLSTIREQIGELRGRLGNMPGETFDPSQLQTQIAALENRGLPPEVLERLRAVESREGPDEAAIAERVRSGINPRIADLRGQLESSSASFREQSERLRSEQERLDSEASARASVRDAELAGLREQQQAQQSASQRAIQEVGGRIDPLQERLAALRERQGEATAGRRAIEERLGGRLGDVEGQVNPLAERISQLRGRLDDRPRFDEAALTRRIKESITPQKVDVDALRRQIQEGIKVPTVDLGGIREQIGQLRGRLDERPQLTSDAVQRMIKESMGNRTTAGIKPARQPSPPPKSAAFPPGYRGGPR